MATVPMIAPDGTLGDVPVARAHEAAAGGFKLGAELISPDGKVGVVPYERVHDAIAAGFQLKPPGIEAPANPLTSARVEDTSAGAVLKNAAKNIYQVSTPGIAASLLNKFSPATAAKLPAALTENASPAEQLPGQIVMNAAPMMVGDELPITAREPEALVRPVAQPTAQPSAAAGIASKLARHIPYLGKVLQASDLAQELLGKTETPSPVATVPEAVPSTDGVQWGEGKFGTPIDKFGKRIEPTPVANKPSPIERDATLNKRNIPEYAGEDYGELKQATADVVDKAIPPSADRSTNLITKAQVELKLKNGDVAGAEQALDSAAKKAIPSYMTPDRPSIVPSTQNIRDNEAMAASAETRVPQVLSRREIEDDAGVSQEMNWDLEKHGYRAESEARREFISRNSTGVTKGSMAKPDVAQPSTSLQQQLQTMLDAARALKK